jgi:hypothetical protein
MEAVMKPFALFRGIAVVALAVSLEAAFLLDASVPPRTAILAERRAAAARSAAVAGPAVDASPALTAPAFLWAPSDRAPRPPSAPAAARRPVARPGSAR